MKLLFGIFLFAQCAVAFAQLELTPPVVGPFSIKGHKLWSFGPLVDYENRISVIWVVADRRTSNSSFASGQLEICRRSELAHHKVV
jgi:hypothetical protein